MSHKYNCLFTEEQAEFIKKNIAGKKVSELTLLFNARFGLDIKESQMRFYKKNHGLKSGVNASFSKGHIPFNKGMKGLFFGGVQTQFKKGRVPDNYLPVGSERVRTPHSDRCTRDDYIDVKIADPNKWRGKHILIWEAANGPVPKGHAIIFGDGNNRNFDLDNLICVSQGQLATLNKKNLIQNDADLTRTAIIMVDISSKIRERKCKAGKTNNNSNNNKEKPNGSSTL